MELAMIECGRTSVLDERFCFHGETDFADALLPALPVAYRCHLQTAIPQSGGGL
jgi:hypothetical protein